MTKRDAMSNETTTSPRTKKPNPATRRRILDLLKRQGEMSARALGDVLSVTPMAARLHLFALEEEGILTHRNEPHGRGRPTKYWRLTDAAQRLFPDAHQNLAVQLINTVTDLFGEKGLAQVTAQHAELQKSAYRERLKGAKTLAEKTKRLAEARDAEGYMAEVTKDGQDWLFIENHCPICAAATACTRLCAMELDVFRETLGPGCHIEREEHILSGARRCAYRIKSTR